MKTGNLKIEDKKINIIYQDNHIIVINKKDGLLSHANRNTQADSVVSLLKKEKIQLFRAEDSIRDGIVHRLDKDTSGLMVLAKDGMSYRALTSQFYNREVKKIYKAYCWSIPMPIAGTINKPISNFLNKKKIKINSFGKEAITEYKVLKKFNDHFSELECKILTGRTHQIRVHMQSIKCPLIGDQLYSKNRNISKKFSDQLQKLLMNFKRQALHAQSLTFKHPINSKKQSFFVEEPYDMKNLKYVLIEEFKNFC